MKSKNNENKKNKFVIILASCIIIYALGLKFVPDLMPFNGSSDKDDFYAPHSSCFQDPEF